MKKSILILTLLTAALGLLACFMDDPKSYFGTSDQQTGGGDGGGVWVETIRYPFNAGNTGLWNGISMGTDTSQSFPMTFYSEFTGFADGSRITRACLLYLSKQGYWVILKDIKNPEWKVDSNTGDARSIFGKMSLPGSFGYQPGEILIVRTYYKSVTGKETFNLEYTLKEKVLWPQSLTNVVKIYVNANTTPE